MEQTIQEMKEFKVLRRKKKAKIRTYPHWRGIQLREYLNKLYRHIFMMSDRMHPQVHFEATLVHL